MLVVLALALPAHAAGPSLDLGRHLEVLQRFQDCSTHLWFDKGRGRLIADDLALPAPDGAVTAVGDGYVRIAVTAKLDQFAVKWLLLPAFHLPAGGSQNSVALAGKADAVRDRLAKAWNLRFVKGVPEGPDVDPDAIAYYTDPPKQRPMLVARAGSGQTTISCPVKATSSRP